MLAAPARSVCDLVGPARSAGLARPKVLRHCAFQQNIRIATTRAGRKREITNIFLLIERLPHLRIDRTMQNFPRSFRIIWRD
jgi:hypothetical protein